MKINVNTITKGLIIGGMILSSSLQVKAFVPTNNVAACAAGVAAAASFTVNAANKAANAEERERDKEVRAVYGFIALLCFSIALFLSLFIIAFKITRVFLGKDNDI